eukprot:892369_1
MFVLIPMILLIAVNSQGRYAPDKVTNLPGLNFKTNYDQYSGYLNLSSGHHLHYWLTESQNKPDTDPLVVWMNGGPGCSSLDGLLYELGPIHVYDNATLWDNSKYSWNNYANTLFLEAPVCVGFSYEDGSNTCSMNDNTTANDNYHAILKFLDEFPVYANAPLYITGESYGGVYVPTLTLRILQGNANIDKENNPKVNIKGFAVGNGVTSSAELSNSIKWYYYHHGMISEEGWNGMQQACCTGNYDRNSCNFHNGNTACRNAINTAENGCCNDINPYNLYGDCIRIGDALHHQYLDESNQLYSWHKLKREIEFNNINIGNYDDIILGGSPPCVDSKGGTTWLNRNDVKAALHVKSNIEWTICSNTLHYQSIWSGNMNPIYDQIFTMDKNIYMTMYNGDTDTVCNFLGDQWFMDDRNLTTVANWREWYYTDTAGQQVGGWTKDFDRVHFVTVRGAGHMVPQYRPASALKMFQYFLENKNLD